MLCRNNWNRIRRSNKKSDTARQLFVSFMYFLPSLKILPESNKINFYESTVSQNSNIL